MLIYCKNKISVGEDFLDKDAKIQPRNPEAKDERNIRYSHAGSCNIASYSLYPLFNTLFIYLINGEKRYLFHKWRKTKKEGLNRERERQLSEALFHYL